MQCPWINVATVTALTGAPVSLDPVKKTDEGGECLFRYANGKMAYRVRVIDVSAAEGAVSLAPYESQCASKRTRLNGIGNEAFLCSAKPRLPYAAQVIGRVRNQVFIIDLPAGSMMEGSAKGSALRDQADAAAEQVAGNLF